MHLARIASCGLLGVEAVPVDVEVHVSNGLPAFTIVGLPETSVKEAKDRVRSALINSGFEFPAKRLTVSLAPADLPKTGGRYDLPIAIGILAASGQLNSNLLQHSCFVGELALSGELRHVEGAIASTLAATKQKQTLCLPEANASMAARVPNSRVCGASSLQQLSAQLAGQLTISLAQAGKIDALQKGHLDFADVVGQQSAKRAMELSAIGKHNLLMLGPPGTGKTMLASRLPSILPPLSESQAIDVASIYSLSTQARQECLWYEAPFRAPHHSASMAALVGGGSQPRPGEVSLAHHGVLFLDELPEFSRHVLDALRQPLESASVLISRATKQVNFPAHFQLIAAMNPSPCGYYQGQHMRSNPDQILRYLRRLSGPFLDRFDLSIELNNLPQGALATSDVAESSAQIRQRVMAAQARALARRGKLNGQLSARELKQDAKLQASDSGFLEDCIARLGLSARAYHRIWRLARSIADAHACQNIERAHLSEALGYRAIERLFSRLTQ